MNDWRIAVHRYRHMYRPLVASTFKTILYHHNSCNSKPDLRFSNADVNFNTLWLYLLLQSCRKVRECAAKKLLLRILQACPRLWLINGSGPKDGTGSGDAGMWLMTGEIDAPVFTMPWICSTRSGVCTLIFDKMVMQNGFAPRRRNSTRFAEF